MTNAYNIRTAYKKFLKEDGEVPAGAMSSAPYMPSSQNPEMAIYALFKPGDFKNRKKFKTLKEMQTFKLDHPDWKEYDPQSGKFRQFLIDNKDAEFLQGME